MISLSQTINQVRDSIFKNIHKNNLIYNTCWEDPRCDRELLQFGPESKIVMITSAGCNALDYLLDRPEGIHTIDMNPRQNALLELKKALFENGNYEDLWLFFGNGHHPEAVKVYAENLRPLLSEEAQNFWDRNVIHFRKKSFYFYGTSGLFAWICNRYFDAQPKVRQLINQLLDAQSLEEQEEIYNKIEPQVINYIVKWVLNRHLTMTMLGVPRAQRKLIVDEYPGGVASFVVDSLRHIFTKLPIKDNYFWRLYLTGKYSRDCAPEYLKEDNFPLIRARLDRLHQYTTTISDFLKNHPDAYTHYILLDHQDWLAAHDIPALNEEWELIMKNSQAGSQILMRSAAMRIDFFPDFAKEALTFETEQTKIQHQKDRVGTYGSVYMGQVK